MVSLGFPHIFLHFQPFSVLTDVTVAFHNYVSTLKTKNESRVEHAESIKDDHMDKFFFKLDHQLQLQHSKYLINVTTNQLIKLIY